MDDTGANMLVMTSSLTRKAPNMGILSIELAGAIHDIPGGGSVALKITAEIDWVAINKDLRTHPMFDDSEDDSDDVISWLNQYPITMEGWAKIEAWRAETNVALKTADPLFKYKDAEGAEQTLSEAETYAAKKILKGNDSYNIYAPVVKKTSLYKDQPPNSGAGYIEDPTVTIDIPEPYKWLKTACRSTQNQDKTWQLVEEWTGADSIDTDLYPDHGAPGSSKSKAKQVKKPARKK
jgi:hypothetical protein